MALTDLITSQPDDSSGSDITCVKYTRGEGKRCIHYLPNGGCALPDELMCAEWLKRNSHIQQPARDLFGNPAPELDLRRQEPKEAEASSDPRQQLELDEPDDRPPARGLTTEDIDSFRALGAEVCLRSESFGEIWLVPEYTGSDRKEITPEHAATICQVTQAFPGAQVVSFEKNPKPDKEVDP